MSNEITKKPPTINGELTANEDKFVKLLSINKRNQTPEQLRILAQQQFAFFNEHCESTPALKNVSPLSVVMAMRFAIVNNLTMDPTSKLLYLIPETVNGTLTVSAKPTQNGWLSLAYQTGAILGHKRPVVEFDDKNVVKSVTFSICKPIVGGGNFWDDIVFDNRDFKIWRDASAKRNRGTANALYTAFNGDIHPEFARSKTIIHTCRKLGINMNAPVGTIRREVPEEVEAEFRDSELMDNFEIVEP